MPSEPLEFWDSNRLTVASRFASILQANGLVRFEQFWNNESGEFAKNLLRERTTTRILLKVNGMDQAFYLKRHSRPPWKEYVKPLLRFTVPILGARNEWNAIHAFRLAGIRTMTPVAVGESGSRSFLLTEGLVGFQSLAELEERISKGSVRLDETARQQIIQNVADTAARMHASRLHHQDFYFHHLLVPDREPQKELVVIDLGRVRQLVRLGNRWRVKDLGQLLYSARHRPVREQMSFLSRYLGHPPRRTDRGLIRRIQRKAASIARHSERNSLG